MADDTKTDPPKTDPPDALGEAGRKALEEERKARRDAEKRAKEAEARITELESTGKSDSHKIADQLAAVQKDLDDERRERRVLEVATAKGLTPAHVKRLSGTTKEELDASADELLADFPVTKGTEGEGGEEKGGGTPPPSRKPAADLKGGGDPTIEVGETDPAKLAASVPRY